MQCAPCRSVAPPILGARAPPTLAMEPLQVAEEVVESSPNKLEDIYRLLAEGSFPASFCSIKKKNLKRYARKFLFEGGCLYYVGPKNEEKREVLVDTERRHHVFLENHLTESGHHLGQKKTVNRIQTRYYWLGVVKDVIDWIKLCETCQNAEYHKYPSKKCKPVTVDHPWEILGLSFHGPFPPSSQLNTYVITVIDFFTKWIEATAVPRNDVMCVAKVLASIYYRFGAAKSIYTNQTWDFCEEVTRLLCERWNISQALTVADTVDHTGLDERSYDLLKSSIRRVVNSNQRDWDEHLDPFLFQFRTLINPVTKQTPFFLMFNRNVHFSTANHIAEASNGFVCPRNDDLVQYTPPAGQRATVGQMVMANASSADKPETKNVQESRRGSLPVTCRGGGEEEEYGSAADQAFKKLKHDHIVSFKFETVLSSNENVAMTEKNT